MAIYCTCEICKASPGKPKDPASDGSMEKILGKRVNMKAGWTLVHYGKAKFTNMYSTEIHHFIQAGHMLRVGASFYLYKAPPPEIQSSHLMTAQNANAKLGIGGGYRYTVADNVDMEAYYKEFTDDPDAAPPQGKEPLNGAEVTVVLGCGGSIIFNPARQATNYDPKRQNTPTFTIKPNKGPKKGLRRMV